MYLLNIRGSVLERLIVAKHEDGVNDKQFVFQKGKIDINSIKTIDSIRKKAYQNRKYAVLICPDIKNAFN